MAGLLQRKISPLDNNYPCKVRLNGNAYTSVQDAFSRNSDLTTAPKHAKIEVLETLLRQKFSDSNPDLKKWLLKYNGELRFDVINDIINRIRSELILGIE